MRNETRIFAIIGAFACCIERDSNLKSGQKPQIEQVVLLLLAIAMARSFKRPERTLLGSSTS